MKKEYQKHLGWYEWVMPITFLTGERGLGLDLRSHTNALSDLGNPWSSFLIYKMGQLEELVRKYMYYFVIYNSTQQTLVVC